MIDYHSMEFKIGSESLRMSDVREIAYLLELHERKILPTVENLVDKIYRDPKVFITDSRVEIKREEHIKIVRERLEQFSEKNILTKQKTGKIFKKVTYLPTDKTVNALNLNDIGYRNWIILANRFKDVYTPKTAARIKTTLESIT